MIKPVFEIGAKGIDADKIVEKIRASTKEKIGLGFYTDACVARAERNNLSSLKDEDAFLTFYLECLRDAVFVDISDFEIVERRNKFSSVFVSIKRFVWKLLKFYTYRLWSQQNQVNGSLLAAIESIENKHRDKISSLTERIEELEKKSK